MNKNNLFKKVFIGKVLENTKGGHSGLVRVYLGFRFSQFKIYVHFE